RENPSLALTPRPPKGPLSVICPIGSEPQQIEHLKKSQVPTDNGDLRPAQNAVMPAMSLLILRRPPPSAIGVPVLMLSRTAGSLRTYKTVSLSRTLWTC